MIWDYITAVLTGMTLGVLAEQFAAGRRERKGRRQ